MFTDSHCHLQDDRYKNDLEQVIQDSLDADVTLMLVPGTDIKTSRQAVQIAENHDGIYASVGIHPHEAKEASENFIAELKEMVAHPKVVAIGEIGLDYHYDFSPRDVQHKIFTAQINLAKELNLPVIIHTRESTDDLFMLMDKNKGWDLEGVFHCFPGNQEEANHIIKNGMFISYPGIITFKKSNKQRDIARQIPIEKLLLETDSPYMSPEPFRGKRNSPANIPYIAEAIAKARGISTAEVAEVTTQAFKNLFKIDD